jgi:hypothetical protein
MRAPARLALGFVVSVALGALAQRGVVAAFGDGDADTALLILVPLAALITAVFGVVAWRGWTATRIGRTAAALVAVLVVLGLGLTVAGFMLVQPGALGHLPVALALFVDAAVLLPAIGAVLVQWLLLRHPPEPPSTAAVGPA